MQAASRAARRPNLLSMAGAAIGCALVQQASATEVGEPGSSCRSYLRGTGAMTCSVAAQAGLRPITEFRPPRCRLASPPHCSATAWSVSGGDLCRSSSVLIESDGASSTLSLVSRLFCRDDRSAAMDVSISPRMFQPEFSAPGLDLANVGTDRDGIARNSAVNAWVASCFGSVWCAWAARACLALPNSVRAVIVLGSCVPHQHRRLVGLVRDAFGCQEGQGEREGEGAQEGQG